MNYIVKRRGKDTASVGNAIALTTSMFLSTYVSHKELLVFVDDARIEDVQEFEALLNLMKEGLKVSIPRQVRVDRGGLNYKYLNFFRANGPEGVKVVVFGNVNQFLIDYRDKKFTLNFSLEELIAEAEKV